MKFTPQSIPDVVLIEPKVHEDNRGYFTETFRQDLFEEAIGYEVNFIQDNESKSTKGVLRGLHYQLTPFTQAKLVRVIDVPAVCAPVAPGVTTRVDSSLPCSPESFTDCHPSSATETELTSENLCHLSR